MSDEPPPSRRSVESLRAAEDEYIFNVLDQICRPCPRCGEASFQYKLGPDGQHESPDVCDLVRASKVLES